MRSAEKIGRNDPCPCGSGAKYKKCCFNKVKEISNDHFGDQNIQPIFDNSFEYDLEAANKYLQGNNFVEAEKIFTDVLAKNPNQSEALYMMGSIHEQRGDIDAAIHFVEKAMNVKKNAQYLHSFGSLLEKKIEYVEQKEELSKLIAGSYLEAIKIDKTYAPAYASMGKLYFRARRMEDAAKYFGEAIKINPGDRLSKYFLSIASGETITQTPPEFVSQIFDSYAEEFDHYLEETLEYEAPQIIASIVREIYTAEKKENENIKLLDIGCGTGLVGQYLAANNIRGHFTGVDLAEKMLSKAKEKGVYTSLVKDEINHFMKNCEQKFDVITGGDVFVYIGKLDGIFESASRLLKNSGMFIFTMENCSEGEEYRVKSTIRYGHSMDYIRKLSERNDFVVHTVQKNKIRREHDGYVGGKLVVLIKE